MDKSGSSGCAADDCASGELCVGCAETILRSLLGIISGSEGRYLPGEERHGRVWSACAGVRGWYSPEPSPALLFCRLPELLAVFM